MIEIIYAKRKSIRYIAFTPCYPWADPNIFFQGGPREI